MPRVSLTLLACVLLLASSAHAQAAWNPDGRCYIAGYAQPVALDTLGMAATIELLPGDQNGAVRTTRFRADTAGSWQMFQAGARWVRVRADSLQLVFGNGFSSVTYDLRIRGDTLVGSAGIWYDFRTGGPDPSVQVRATRTACPAAPR